MKRTAALIMTAVILLVYVISVDAFTIVYDGKVEDYPWDPIVLVVDGQTVETKDMPPIILNGRTLVPAREFFEQLGAKVTWDHSAQRVIIDYNNERIILKINSRTVYIGSNSATISPSDPAPKIINDKTMIPVRFVAEEFGFTVEWENDTRTVRITSPDAADVRLTNVVFSSEKDIDTDSIFIALDEFVNPNIFKMQNPDRIVIDVYGTKASISDGRIEANGEAVQTVRYSQHPDRFRVVADLKTDADYEVFKLKNGIEISVIKTGDDGTTDIPSEDKDTNLPSNDGELIVVVDAGHGGSDPGAIYPVGSKNPSIREKDVTLDIALKVGENLKNAGVKVIFTRTDDSYPTLKERVKIANTSNADLFVSIHCNAMDNKDNIDGAQVYHYGSSSFGKKFANIVYENIIENTTLTKRGVQDGSSFYVLKNTKMPAILTESGFISNEDDREYLKAEKNRQKIADAISEGVLEAIELL